MSLKRHQFPVCSLYMHCCNTFRHSHTMTGIVVLQLFLILIPAWVACSGEGNIRLLEEEVAIALKACTIPNDKTKAVIERQKRSDGTYDSSLIDDGMKEESKYYHERRLTNDQIQVLNATESDGTGNGDKLLTSAPGNERAVNSTLVANRTKRSEPLLNKPDTDQVDSRGIPREAELWNKVQTTVTSQQSRSALRDQIRACFQELQSEAEDNGCSYSNKLERCLMLRFADRKTDRTEASTPKST